MRAAVGTFTINTTTGTQVVPVSLQGLTPKVVIIWGSRQTADGLVSGAVYYSFGMATSPTNRIGIFGCGRDDFGNQGGCGHDGTAVILQQDPVDGDASVEAVRADLNALGANSFTIDVELSDGVADIYNYIVISGEDVEANIVSSPMPTGASQLEDIPHGLSGTPDLVFGLSGHNINDPIASPGRDRDHNELSIFASDFTTTRWTGVHADQGHFGYRMQNDWLVAHMTTAVLERGNFSDIDETNLTVDWLALIVAEYVHYLFIRGVDAKVGTFESPISADDVIVSPGFTPKLFIPWGFMDVASSSGTDGEDDMRMSFGAADGTNQTCVGLLKARTPRNSDSVQDSDGVLTVYDHAEAEQESATAAISGDDVAVSFDPADANANEWNYLVLGGAEPDSNECDICFSGPAGTRIEIVHWDDLTERG